MKIRSPLLLQVLSYIYYFHICKKLLIFFKNSFKFSVSGFFSREMVISIEIRVATILQIRESLIAGSFSEFKKESADS